MAALLDFGACANAALDNKVFSSTEYQATRQRLQNAGVGPLVDEYLRQLRKLERRRPSSGGDHRQYEDVRSYREAVARLSLGIVAAMALGDACSENGTRSTFFDDELKALFRIVMQCQIIDDVLDYAQDLSTGLPSFLTGTASLPQALELTAEAARNYADGRDLRQSADLFPLRVAVVVVSAIAKLVIRIRHCQHRMRRAGQLPESHTKQIQVLTPAVQRTGTSR